MTLTADSRAAKREYDRRRREAKQAAGECYSCSSPAEPGRNHCTAHRKANQARCAGNYAKRKEYHAAYAAGRYARWKAEGRCLQCGKERLPGQTMCIKHAEYGREIAKRRYRAGVCTRCCKPNGNGFRLCDECRPRFSEQQVRLREGLKAKGLCKGWCGSPSRPGKNYCGECARKYRDMRVAREADRRAKSLCITCGSHAAVPGGTSHRCQGCYLRRLATQVCKSASMYRDLLTMFERQGGRCVYSGRPLTIGVDAELDHIFPESRGGGSSLSNLQWVWSVVNTMKQDLTEAEFLDVVRLIARHADG